MQAQCKATELRTTLERVGPVVNRKSVIPILAGVRLTAEGGRLTVDATNLDIAISATVDAFCGHDGRTVVDYRDLLTTVKALKGDIVLELAPDQKSLVVATGTGSISLPTMVADEWPSGLGNVGAASSEYIGTIDAGELVSAIGRVEWASVTDAPRPSLASVYLECRSDHVRLTSSDGFRLSTTRAPASVYSQQRKLLPNWGARAAVKAFGKLQGPIGMALARLEGDDTNAYLELECLVLTHGTGGLYTTLTTRLLAGNFPNYQAVIPTQHTHALAVDRKAMLGAVKAMGLSRRLDEGPQGVDLTLNGSLALTRTVDGRTSTQTLTVDRLAGEEAATIKLDATYLADLLTAMNSERVVLEWQDHYRPFVAYPQYGKEQHTIVTMPMRR